MKYIYSLMYWQTNSVAEGGTCDEVPTHTHTLYTSYSVSFSLIISIPCTYPNYQHLLVYSVRQLCFALPHVSPATHAPQLTPYLPTHQISLHTTQPLALLHHTTSSASSVSPCQLPVYVLQICIHS